MKRWLLVPLLLIISTSAYAQFPGDPLGRGREARIIAPTIAGCLNARLADLTFETYVDDIEATLVDSIAIEAAYYLDVDIDSAVFSGPDSYNAFATPSPILGGRSRDGVALVGRALIQRERKELGREWRVGVAMISAHEVGHLAIFKAGLELSTIRGELLADYLAGWVLGKRFKRGYTDWSDRNAALKAISTLGKGSFSGEAVHGSAQQRARAFSAGYAEAFRSNSLKTIPFDEGIETADALLS